MHLRARGRAHAGGGWTRLKYYVKDQGERRSMKVDLSSHQDQGYGLTPGGYARGPRRERRLSPNRKAACEPLANNPEPVKEPMRGMILAGLSDAEMEQRCHLRPGMIRRYRLNAKWCADYDMLRELARVAAQEVIDASLVELAEREVQLAKGGLPYRRGKTEAEAASRQNIFKGRKVLDSGAQVAIQNNVGVFSADDIARAFREARKQLAEDGGGSVGLPDRAVPDK